MSGDFGPGSQTDYDSKTSGRWSKEEHEKFIEGMPISLYSNFISLNFRN
jgi:hypothetical protein